MDYNAANEALQSDAYAQQLAAEQAVRERVQRMTPEEQAAALDGMKIALAKPTPPPPVKAPSLNAYRASELYGKHLEPTRMIVQHMVPCGLTVLAGAPKRGKSWLALALAIAVASGADFLGNRTQRGSVLYLDLESRQYRVQERLRKLIPGPAPDMLYIAHEAQELGARLYQQLDAWVQDASEPALIIIDTLARIRPAGKRNENAYESDPRQYGELQKWASGKRVAVVVVHHLRKSKESDDWYDRINGSNGLVGVADAVIGLMGKRGDPVSRLNVTGRDIDGDYSMAIRFDNGKWIMESSDSERYEEQRAFESSALMRGIFEFMYERHEWQGSAAQLIDDICAFTRQPMPDCTTAAVGRDLRRFSDMMYQQSGILINTRRTSSRRVIHIENTKYVPARLDAHQGG